MTSVMELSDHKGLEHCDDSLMEHTDEKGHGAL